MPPSYPPAVYACLLCELHLNMREGKRLDTVRVTADIVPNLPLQLTMPKEKFTKRVESALRRDLTEVAVAHMEDGEAWLESRLAQLSRAVEAVTRSGGSLHG